MGRKIEKNAIHKNVILNWILRKLLVLLINTLLNCIFFCVTVRKWKTSEKMKMIKGQENRSKFVWWFWSTTQVSFSHFCFSSYVYFIHHCSFYGRKGRKLPKQRENKKLQNKTNLKCKRDGRSFWFNCHPCGRTVKFSNSAIFYELKCLFY